MKKNESAVRFAVCEDFWRLNQLKCGAPELIQAKREPNPSGANWKYAESVLSEFAKKFGIRASCFICLNLFMESIEYFYSGFGFEFLMWQGLEGLAKPVVERKRNNGGGGRKPGKPGFGW